MKFTLVLAILKAFLWTHYMVEQPLTRFDRSDRIESDRHTSALFADAYTGKSELKQRLSPNEPDFLTFSDPFQQSVQSVDNAKMGGILKDTTPQIAHIDAGTERTNSSDSTQAIDTQLKDVGERIDNAGYPRIGEAWTGADNLKDQPNQGTSKHDLYFGSVESLGLKWKMNEGDQSADLDEKSVSAALEKREKLLKQNPNMVMLAEVRYHDAQASTYKSSSDYWKHNPDGSREPNPDYKQFDLLDYTNPAFQDHVAAQAKAALESGAVDGVMLDWWHEGKDAASDAAKLQLLRKVREAVGPDALIMINTNETTMPPETTSLVNGYYMECAGTNNMQTPQSENEEWEKIENTLDYAQSHTRTPRINMVEGWWEKGSKSGREELDKMRALTTLVMTHSDGYSLFADPDNNGKTPDHTHSWYKFYDTDPGRPLGDGIKSSDGSSRREFDKGTVISNAVNDHPVSVKFEEDRIQASTGETIKAGQTISINGHDGDIFLRQN